VPHNFDCQHLFQFIFFSKTPEESESETEEETQDTTSFQEYYSIVKNAILHGKVEKTRTAILTAFYNIPPNIIEGHSFLRVRFLSQLLTNVVSLE
jgi:hypothetical protein